MKLSQRLNNITIIRVQGWIKVTFTRVFLTEKESLTANTPKYEGLVIQWIHRDGKSQYDNIHLPIFTDEVIYIADTKASADYNTYSITLAVCKADELPPGSCSCKRITEVEGNLNGYA